MGRTCVHWAALGGAVEVVEVLLHCGVSVLSEDEQGNAALHLVCRSRSMPCVKLVAQAAQRQTKKEGGRGRGVGEGVGGGGGGGGGEISAAVAGRLSSRTGASLLHHAAANGDVACVKLLLDAKAPLLGDEHSITPLHVAVSRTDSDLEILETFLRHIAAGGTGGAAQGGRGTLHTTKTGIAQKVESQLERAKAVYEQCKGTDHRYVVQSTSTFETVPTTIIPPPQKHGDQPVKTPREINKGDEQGLTPLHYAVMRGGLSALRMLLASPDVDVNVRDSWQRTPMMLAVARGDEAAVVALMSAGALAHGGAAADGETCVDLALKGKHGSILVHMLQGSSGAVSAGAAGVAGSVTIASSVHRASGFQPDRTLRPHYMYGYSLGPGSDAWKPLQDMSLVVARARQDRTVPKVNIVRLGGEKRIDWRWHKDPTRTQYDCSM